MASDKLGCVRWGSGALFAVLFGVLLAAGCAALQGQAHGPVTGQPEDEFGPAGSVFWEGEAAEEGHTFNGRVYARNMVYPGVLSGGAWLSNWAGREEGRGRGRMESGCAGHWCALPLRRESGITVRSSGGSTTRRENRQVVVQRAGLMDEQNLTPQATVNWVSMGVTPNELTKGQRVFHVRLLDKAEKYVGIVDGAAEGVAKGGAFDCFVMSPTEFFPQGNPHPISDPKAAEWGYLGLGSGHR